MGGMIRRKKGESIADYNARCAFEVEADKIDAPAEKPAEAAPLPKGIREADLKYPKYTEKGLRHLYEKDFEVWFTKRFGWAVPTLTIRDVPGRLAGSGKERRTYAITVADSALIRMGFGPHVLRVLKVYVTEANEVRLKPFLDLREKGAGMAGETRDRISTRRAQSAHRRYGGGYAGGGF